MSNSWQKLFRKLKSYNINYEFNKDTYRAKNDEEELKLQQNP